MINEKLMGRPHVRLVRKPAKDGRMLVIGPQGVEFRLSKGEEGRLMSFLQYVLLAVVVFCLLMVLLTFNEKVKQRMAVHEVNTLRADVRELNQRLHERTQGFLRSRPTGIEAMVCADIAARQKFGVQKYGTTVQANQLPLRDWLKHAYEESLDFPIYLKRAMQEIDEGRAS